MPNKIKLLPRTARPGAATIARAAGVPAAARGGLGLHPLPRLIDSRRDDRDEILAALRAPQASIAPKYLYDPLGSKLFEAITELPEYYPTRTEAEILARRGGEIAALAGRGGVLIDLGAGNCAKAAALFGNLRPAQYVAIDIAEETLGAALNGLRHLHPGIAMLGLAQDFSQGLTLPAQVRARQRLFFYPGSSIGNFDPDSALQLLERIRALGGDDGSLLIGIDLAKGPAQLEAAYDDALGVTRAFNLNVLNHVNALVGTDFRPGDWDHLALFNAARSRVEMHLRARAALAVAWPGGTRAFAAGETIHTENSYKFTRKTLAALLDESGFTVEQTWTDPRQWYALTLAGLR